MEAFAEMVVSVKEQLTERPQTVIVFGDEVAVEYCHDDEYDEGFYARVAIPALSGVLGEVENDTIGELTALRFSLANL